MRRPSIACQRAVQSLQPPAQQHVWVPDDVLSLAVHRFFRSPCPHQKRNGSHVPGPLEARRRAAKRRMTVSAGFYPTDVFPPSFNLGALFGFRPSPKPSWRYEPPSLPRNITSLDLSSPLTPPTFAVAPPPSSTPDSVPRSSTLPTTRDTTSTNENSRLEESEPLTTDGNQASQATLHPPAGLCYNDAFAKFQLQTTHADQRCKKRQRILLRKAFLACCPASGLNAWKYNVMVIRHVLDQGWYWAPIIKEYDANMFPSIHESMFSELLDCLQTILSRAPGDLHIHQLLQDLAQSALHAEHIETPYLDDHVSRLIQQLWQSSLSRGSQKVPAIRELMTALANKLRSKYEQALLTRLISDQNNAKTQILRSVARVIERPKHLARAKRALSCMPGKLLVALVPEVTLHLAKAIPRTSSLPCGIHVKRLSVWLQLVQGLESNTDPAISLFDSALAALAKVVSASRSSDRLRPETFTHAVLSMLAEQEDFKSERARQFIKRYSSSMWEQSHDSFATRLEHLVLKLRDDSLPCDRLLELSLTLVARHATLDLVLRCLNMLNRQQLPVSDAVLHACIDRMADTMGAISVQTGTVANKKAQHDAYALRMCKDIQSILDQSNPLWMSLNVPSTLDRDSSLSRVRAMGDEMDMIQATRQFEHLICRAQDSHTLPIAFRDSTRDLSKTQRIGLVHQLAHLYSQDTTRTHRQSYRSIFYLYRYLTENDFPIGPLFSRSVVQIAITRPLSENRFVSARRLIWVCHLVTRVEGASAARQLESEFYQRRGDAISHAKSVFVSLGGDTKNKAHISTMKGLGLI